MTDEQEKRTKMLIVSLPGMMQRVLQETFTKRADVNLVGIACGGLSAIQMIWHHQPALIVINSNLPEDETRELIQWLKNEQPQILSVAIGETSQQIRRAAAAGADFTLRSYSLSDNLDRLLGNVGEN
jgi:DNA-binding NarL/FixJ family response regulator